MKKTIAILLAVVCSLGAAGAWASEGDTPDTLVARWAEVYRDSAGWEKVPEAESSELTPLESLRVAAEMILRMGLETPGTLAAFKPRFQLMDELQWQYYWFVIFEPPATRPDTKPYTVEVLSPSGEVKSVFRRYPYESGPKTVLDQLRDADITAQTPAELAEQWSVKYRGSIGWMLHTPGKNGALLTPGKDDLSQQDAARVAIEAMADDPAFSVPALIAGYTPYFLFRNEEGRRVWTIRLMPLELIGDTPYAAVRIDAKTGEVISAEKINPMRARREDGIQEEAYRELLAVWKDCGEWYGYWEPMSGTARREGEIGAEEALRLAVDRIFAQQTDWCMETLYAFTPSFDFYDTTVQGGNSAVPPGQRVWWIVFSRNSMHYDVIPNGLQANIDASARKVTRIAFGHSQFPTPPTSALVGSAYAEAADAVIREWTEAYGEDVLAVRNKPFANETEYTDLRVNDYLADPSANDLPVDKALAVAVEALRRFGVDPSALSAYKPTVRFAIWSERRYWVFQLLGEPADPSLYRSYVVEVESPSGFFREIMTQ